MMKIVMKKLKMAWVRYKIKRNMDGNLEALREYEQKEHDEFLRTGKTRERLEETEELDGNRCVMIHCLKIKGGMYV